MSKVMIYSNEHKGWWKPYYFGYTQCSKEAGIFDLEDAIKKYPKLDYDTSNEDFLVDVSIESIDNANPSEALECLERIEADLIGLPKHVTEYDNIFDDYLYDIENNIDTLKQALLKAQEPKQYLKWEDLEFGKTTHKLKAKMNGNLYRVEWYIDGMGSKVVYIYKYITNDYLVYCACIKDNSQQFFNDLHLERVEE